MATVNLKKKGAYVLSKLADEGFIKKKDSYYYISYTKYDYFIKLVGDVLIFTNDLSLVTDVKKSTKALYETKISNDIIKKSINSSLYAFIDIDKILAKIPSGSERFVAPAAATFDNIEFKSKLIVTNDMNSDFALNFKKKDDNAIHILLDLANEYFKLFTGK